MASDFQHNWTVPPVNGSQRVPYQAPWIPLPSRDNEFAGSATYTLCQIIVAASKCEDETGQFIRTQSWSRVAATTKAKLPYDEHDFVYIIQNYLLVFRKALKVMKSKKANKLSLEPKLQPPSTGQVSVSTLQDLWTLANEHIQSLRDRQEELVELLQMSENELDKIANGRQHVPAASPREIRFWILLNTMEFRARIREELARGMPNFMNFWANTQEIVEQGRDAPGIPRFPKVRNHRGMPNTRDSKRIGPFTPKVFFFCSGISQKGQEVHDVVTVGATQEQLGSWSTLWVLRRDARRNHLGIDDVRSWTSFLKSLSTIEARLTQPLFEFREELMNWRLGISPNRPAALSDADTATIPVLRFCGHHLGQAYLYDPGSFEPIGCCYLCKVSITYSEAKELDIPFQASQFDMAGRLSLPWSCAEVASSKYCDKLGAAARTASHSGGSAQGGSSSGQGGSGQGGSGSGQGGSAQGGASSGRGGGSGQGGGSGRGGGSGQGGSGSGRGGGSGKRA